MYYESELAFFRKILQQSRIHTHVAPVSVGLLQQIDMGLRHSLGLGVKTYDIWECQLRSRIRHNCIYRITDEFTCSYVMLRLPETDSILVIGPFVDDIKDRVWITDFCHRNAVHNSWLPLLEEYFHSVPSLRSEGLLDAAISALADSLWSPEPYTSESIVSGIPEEWIPVTAPETGGEEKILLDLHVIEQRYDMENQLIQAVAQGRSHKVRQLAHSFAQYPMDLRTPDLSRNLKNYSVILNTLLRKAVESGGVHPLYIDRLSSEFAIRIESSATRGDLQGIWEDMAHRYCMLVKKHSMRDYSPLVQKVMARVDFDLTADLSLKANAEALNVNASYLSTLFKKETGTTLTDYVNRKRMEHAAYLLGSTDLSIWAIGQRCGIQDDNYFTKIFKKYAGKTPKLYRQDLKSFPQRKESS